MSTTRDRLEDLARELDMVVFRLESSPRSAGPSAAPDVDQLHRERRRIRRDLELLRDRLEEVARDA